MRADLSKVNQMLLNRINPRRVAALLTGLLASSPSLASMFQGETLDKVADIMAIVVLIIVPVVVIVVFWLVHVLPERFAEKNHHPQAKAIQVLCLLSLVFGGLLWPIAWLWAFTKPVAHKAAYGTDKHDHYFDEMHEKLEAGQLSTHEMEMLRDEIEAIAAKSALPASLRRLRARLDQTAPAAAPAGGGAA
jgi:CBS domain containing-hemolysin-like protein